MKSTLALIFLISSISYAQDSKYRMQASLGLFSVMNPGTRSFEGVYRIHNDYSVYETEVYDIDYKNFNLSSGFHLKVGWDWVQKKHYKIRQSTSFGLEIYQEEIDFTLKDIGFGDSVQYSPYLGSSIVEVGYSEKATAPGGGYVFTQEILFLRNHENISWGGGIAYTFRHRDDRAFNGSPISEIYVPNSRAITFGQYRTHQLGIVFHIEKAFNRGMIYLNLNQQFLTIKKRKGAEYFADGNELNPISHNMDFRYPLLIQFGGAIQFAKNKK